MPDAPSVAPHLNGHAPADHLNGHVAAPANRPVGRAEVMEAVLQAATELFSEKGPDAVTVRQVADRAGVNHALIHRHYGTKEELLRVVLAQAVEQMSAVSQGISNSREDIAPIVTALLEQEPAIRLLAWAILSGYPVERIWPEYPAFRRVQAVLAAEQVDADGQREDPRIAAVTGSALVLGWVIFAPFFERAAGLTDIDGFDPEAMLNTAVQHLFDRAR